MTDKEWADRRCGEREIKRLASENEDLRRRLQAAEREKAALTTARDIALRMSADLWRLGR